MACRCAQVNGKTVMRWVRFLAKPDGYCSRVSARVSETSLRAYERHEGVPESVVAAAAAASTHGEARRMRRVRTHAACVLKCYVSQSSLLCRHACVR